VRFADDGVRGRAWLGVDAPRRNVLDPFKTTSDAAALVRLLGADAIAAGRGKIDLRQAYEMARVAGLPRHVEELVAQLTARGIRLERDVLPLVDGTFAIDVSLVGQPNLDALRRTDPRRLNPFLYVSTTILAPLTDAEKARQLLPQIAPAVARAARGQLEVIEIGGQEAYEIHYRLGKGMTFGISNGMLIVTGGEGSYAKALARVSGSAPGLGERMGGSAALDRLGKEGAVAALVHVPNLVGAVEGLPAESFGGGPTGMMLRSMVDMFIGPVSKLTIVMGSLSVEEHGLVGSFEVGFDPPPVARR
jgi:hypothetical protein